MASPGSARRGACSIENVVTRTDGEQFRVRAWLDGQPAGTFDCTVAHSADNRFSLLVEHEPRTGDSVDSVARRCGE